MSPYPVPGATWEEGMGQGEGRALNLFVGEDEAAQFRRPDLMRYREGSLF